MGIDEEVRNEDLRVGDMVHLWCGYQRIVAIKKYTGPHEFIFGIVDTVPGVGFSLEKGGYTKRVKTP